MFLEVVIIFTLNFLPISSLLVRLSFQSNSDGMPVQTEILNTVINLSIIRRSNLEALYTLARTGDAGLRDGIAASCLQWNTKIINNLFDFCEGDLWAQYIFFSKQVMLNLRFIDGKSHFGLEQDKLERLTMYHLEGQSDSLFDLEMRERITPLDPRGIWWGQYAGNVTSWAKMVQQNDKHYTGLLAQVGTFDMLHGTSDLKGLLQMAGRMANLHRGSSLHLPRITYLLIRLNAMQQVPLLEHMAQREIAALYNSISQYGIYADLNALCKWWLILHQLSSNDYESEVEGTWEWHQKLWNIHTPIMNLRPLGWEIPAAITITLHSNHNILRDHCKSIMAYLRDEVVAKMDSFDMINYLFHVDSYAPAAPVIRNLLKVPTIRRRLLSIPPFRSNIWISPLLRTSLGIEYCRRWILQPSNKLSLSSLYHVSLEKALSSLPWSHKIPRSFNLFGQPIIQILLQQLSHLLNETNAHRLQCLPIGDTIYLKLNNQGDLTYLWATEQLIISIIVRLHLHYNVRAYLFCRSMVRLLRRVNDEGISVPIGIIYPQWPEEDYHSLPDQLTPIN